MLAEQLNHFSAVHVAQLDNIRIHINRRSFGRILHYNMFHSTPNSPDAFSSPDLAACDFLLFPKMKIKLKGRKFDTVVEIEAESQKMAKTLT
jgi:hypothetical protein